MAHATDLMRRANQMMKVMTPAARIVKIQVIPLASENAAPGFRTNWNSSTCPSTWTVSPSVRFETTRYLVSWSRPYATTAAPARTRSAVVVPTFALRSGAKALEGGRRLLTLRRGAHGAENPWLPETCTGVAVSSSRSWPSM